MALRSNRIPYPQTMKNFTAVTTAAKTTETDATNAVDAYAAPSNAPAVVTALIAHARATTTANRLKVYVARAGALTVLYKVKSKLMPATTVSETTDPAPCDLGPTAGVPIKLGAGDHLFVAGGVANTVEWYGEVEEYEAA